MQPRLYRQIDNLADWLGADGWTLVRQNRHAVVEFQFAAGSLRQVFACTPSDVNAGRAARTSAMREMRRAAI
jgi:hypothetical protein